MTSVGTDTWASSALTSVSPVASRLRAASSGEVEIRCSSLNQSIYWSHQHHWLANRMREEDLDLQQSSNAFLRCSSGFSTEIKLSMRAGAIW